MANLLTEAGVKTWFYIFSHPFTADHATTNIRNKAYHQYDLNYVFGTPYQGCVYVDVSKKSQFTDVDRKITNTVMTLLTNFAKYGYVKLVRRVHVKYRNYEFNNQ